MKQQPLLGFLFALITAMAWGSLPIALKQVLSVMTPQTIVWYRFIVAFLALFILLAYKKKLPQFLKGGQFIWLVVIGVIGLSGNFFLFNSSLKFIDPSSAQIFIHFSSFGMLICGLFVFKEKLGLHQKIGLGLLLAGLVLFFNDKLEMFKGESGYLTGVLLSLTASLVWVMYFGCLLVFTPVAEFSQVSNLTPFAFGCFVYCCLNTLFGYGAYAEALNRWEVSKVSVVITLVPLFTILFAHLANYVSPENFAAPELNMISYIGAFVVVCGAILSAIGHKLLPQSK